MRYEALRAQTETESDGIRRKQKNQSPFDQLFCEFCYLLYWPVGFLLFFFFSSRRRHTRFDCDWSSDVSLPIWRPGSDGVEWGELQLRGASEAWRTRVVVARIDPRRIALSLAPAFDADQDWAVHDAEGDVAVALDAGQFRGSLPWGWVVHRGRELLAPQYAPLAGAVVVDSS